jgi:hypothetical protein
MVMRVFVLVIEHRHGRNVYAAATRNLAKNLLFAYVEDWWSQECKGSMPSRPGRAIKAYFDRVDDESWEIIETPLATADNVAKLCKEV